MIELARKGHVTLKQVPDLSATVVGLDKYNRSKYPTTFDIVYPGRGRDGRWLTGVDEGSLEIGELRVHNKKEGDRKAEELKELREELQLVLGIPDLSAVSTFWSSYRVRLDQVKEMDLANPRHQLALRVLLNNREVMPNLSVRNEPQYLRTKFYLHSDKVEAEYKVSVTADKDKAFAELYNLYKAESPRLLLIGKLLFRGKITADMTFATMYTNLKAWLALEKKQENSIKFNEFNALSNELLGVRETILTASEKGLIKNRQKKMVFGEHILGKTMDEVYSNMLKDDMTVIYQMITEAIEKSL